MMESSSSRSNSSNKLYPFNNLGSQEENNKAAQVKIALSSDPEKSQRKSPSDSTQAKQSLYTRQAKNTDIKLTKDNKYRLTLLRLKEIINGRDIDQLSEFLKAHPDVLPAEKIKDLNSQELKNLALRLAAKLNEANAVRYFLKQGAKVNAKDKKGRTALWLAAQHGYIPVAQILIAENGAKLSVKNSPNTSVLHIAAEHQHFELIEAVADICAKSFNKVKWVHLLNCVASGGYIPDYADTAHRVTFPRAKFTLANQGKGSGAALKILLEKIPSEIMNQAGFFVLAQSAARFGNTEVLQVLLTLSEFKNEQFIILLKMAAIYNQPRVVQFLFFNYKFSSRCTLAIFRKVAKRKHHLNALLCFPNIDESAFNSITMHSGFTGLEISRKYKSFLRNLAKILDRREENFIAYLERYLIWRKLSYSNVQIIKNLSETWRELNLTTEQQNIMALATLFSKLRILSSEIADLHKMRKDKSPKSSDMIGLELDPKKMEKLRSRAEEQQQELMALGEHLLKEFSLALQKIISRPNFYAERNKALLEQDLAAIGLDPITLSLFVEAFSRTLAKFRQSPEKDFDDFFRKNIRSRFNKVVFEQIVEQDQLDKLSTTMLHIQESHQRLLIQILSNLDLDLPKEDSPKSVQELELA